MTEYTHEYYDLLYELESMHTNFKNEGLDVSYIRDQLLYIVDSLYCKDWDDFKVHDEDEDEDDE